MSQEDHDARNKMYRRFEKEKKALVPKRDYLDGHPLEDKLSRAFFMASLKHQGHDAHKAFNDSLQMHIRTITSKTYSDIFTAIRYSSIKEMSEAEQEQHLDWVFEQLAEYQESAKKLILKHFRELQNL